MALNDAHGFSAAIPTLMGFNTNGHLVDFAVKKAQTLGLPKLILGTVEPTAGGLVYTDKGRAYAFVNGHPISGHTVLTSGDVLTYKTGTGASAMMILKLVLALTDGAPLAWNKLPLGDALPFLSISESFSDLRISNSRKDYCQYYFRKAADTYCFMSNDNTLLTSVDGVYQPGEVFLAPGTIVRAGEVWYYYTPACLWIGTNLPISLISGKNENKQGEAADPGRLAAELYKPDPQQLSAAESTSRAGKAKTPAESSSRAENAKTPAESSSRAENAKTPAESSSRAENAKTPADAPPRTPDPGGSPAPETIDLGSRFIPLETKPAFPDPVTSSIPLKTTTEPVTQDNAPPPSDSHPGQAVRPSAPADALLPPKPQVNTSDLFRNARLVIDIDARQVRKGFQTRTLLKDIHLEVAPGDFVLILGGSGAGKSTFIKAVMGYDRAEGSIRYGELDVYKNYDKVKYEIGYVPQHNLVRLHDTVYETLLSEAHMKMPDDTPAAAYEQQCHWAMALLGLEAEKNNMCSAISGGQLKRLSIAIELVGDPGLFFLDEPDSGLDGTMSRKLLENLRTIADLGKIVMVITHGPDRAADLFSKILVLGKTSDNVGHLLFYGGIAEAKAFFETDSLEQIVRRINSRAEGGEGLADHYLEKYQTLIASKKS